MASMMYSRKAPTRTSRSPSSGARRTVATRDARDPRCAALRDRPRLRARQRQALGRHQGRRPPDPELAAQRLHVDVERFQGADVVDGAR
jgi:hypothetical protein